jgi:putative toxin-antitoxin system antitoxin component (TIGR02293 family)
MKPSAKVRETPPRYRKHTLASPDKGAMSQHLKTISRHGAISAGGGTVKDVREGFAFSELEALRDWLELPMERLAACLGIARATLHRRKQAGRLTPDESEKVLRFRRLMDQATGIFGSEDEARSWLSRPKRGLGGAVPLEYAGSEIGAREVEMLLGRIDYSVYS